MRYLLPTVLFLALFTVSGCTGVRFTIDLVPTESGMSETVVMGDEPSSAWAPKPSRIALIQLNGLLQNGRPQSLLRTGENPVAVFDESLRRAASDPTVRAVVLSINSRGGSVTASEMLYGELVRFKESTGKPVVVLMEDYCASGGYYVGCVGDELIAGRTTVTGSIGVIMQTFDLSEGLRMIGVRPNAIVSGPNKGIASPFQAMSDEQRAILQGIVDEFYARFRSLVVQNRPGISDADLERVTDGRVVTGPQALEAGLVDSIGDLHDAFARAKELAELERAVLVRYHRAGQSVTSAYAETPEVYINVDLPFEDEIGFYYVWHPRAFGARAGDQ